MGGNSRRALSAVIDARRARVAALKVRGLTIRQIHGALAAEGGAGLNPKTKRAWSTKVICEDLQELTEEWKTDAARKIADHKAEQLEQLAAVRREAWDAWHSSRAPKKRTKTQRRTKPGKPLDDGGVRQEKISDLASVETLEMVGDPRYLAVLLEAEDRRAELLGLDAPKSVNIDAKGSGVMLIPVMTSVDEWEKQAMAAQAALKAAARGEAKPSA